MAGILDSKSRILDVILTQLGREQMSRGEFEISFATFSDGNVQYRSKNSPEEHVLGGISEDLFFEAFSTESDEIIPEISDTGNFRLLKSVSPTLQVKDGILYESTENGYKQVDAFDNISKFTNVTTDRWDSLDLLNTMQTLAGPTFNVDLSTSIKFEIEHKPLPKPESLPPVLVDERFSNSLNTLFLPPVVDSPTGTNRLSVYNNFTRNFNKASVVKEISEKSLAKKRIEIESETKNGTDHYNFLGQAFIGINQEIKKYLVVDAGEFLDDNGVPCMQVYHLGFIFKDSDNSTGVGISKFSRGFSIIFHNDYGAL